MAYSVDTYSGSRTFVVEDGTINTSLDIRLIGKNYAGYGEVQNENFLHLLENFAGTTPPPRPTAGQIWYDSNTRKIKYWDATSSKWKSTGGTEVSSTPPAGLSEGDLWWDDQNQQLYAYNGSTYILIGPDSLGGLGTTQMKSVAVTDIFDTIHPIIQAIVGDTIMFIISESEFELSAASKATNPGFGFIKKGITLRDHNNINGVQDTGETTVFWGTSSDTLKLGGFDASTYLRVGDAFNFAVRFSDIGYTVGDDNDLRVFIESGNIPVIRNQLGNTIKFQTTSGVTTYTPINLVGPNVQPNVTNTTDLGTSTLRFKDVYAGTYNGSGANLTSLNASNLTTGTVPVARLTGTYNVNINGNATNADTANSANTATRLLVNQASPTTGMASTEAILGTVAARTTTTETINGTSITPGSLKATFFVGTATAALYADLAEKYLADQEYEVGTVVSVGGEKEITAAKLGDRALGVVSGNPAYMMNTGLEGGTYVALKGRVPVKVVGPVRKGDRLASTNFGVAEAIGAGPRRADAFAIALETSDAHEERFIEAVIL